MDEKIRQYIKENADRKKPEEIARALGVKPRQVKRELERLQRKQAARSGPSAGTAASEPNARPRLWVFLAFALLTFTLYSNTFDASFHYDDNHYIRHNAALHNPLDWAAIWNWDSPRFITNLTFALNYAAGGESVAGYHFLSILLHLFCGFFLYMLISALFQTPVLRNSPLSARSDYTALFAGLFFLCHPIQTQAVTYIVQRSAVMAALFYIVVCLLYVSSRLRRNEIHYRTALALCAAAMFTKQTAFTLPAALVLTEYFFFSKDGDFARPDRFKRLVPFLFTMTIIPLVRLASVGRDAEHFVETTAIEPLHYFFTQINVIVSYLGLLFRPAGQSILHAYPVSFTLWEPKTLVCLALLGGLFASAVLVRKRQPLYAFGIFWFFLTLSVESSFFPIQHVMFEHRMYLPMAGLAAAFSSLVLSLLGNKKTFALFCAVLFIVLGIAAYQRNAVWKSDETLWKDAASKYKGAENQELVYDPRKKLAVRKRVESIPFDQWKMEQQ